MVEKIRSHMQQNVQVWKQLLDDQLSLVNTLHLEAEKLEKKGVENASRVIDELTKVTKEVVKLSSSIIASQENVEAWKKAMGDQAVRMQTAFGLFGSLEGEGVERAQTLLNDYAQIAKNSMTVAADLHSEWRQMSMDAVRKSSEWMTIKD